MSALVLGVLALPSRHAIAEEAPKPCGGEVIATGYVARVVDGRSLVLSDGREVRLAGIDAPLPEEGMEAGVGTKAKAALEGVVADKEVVLRRSGAASDRYGRVVAQMFAGERWIQAEMVAAGHARVSPRQSDRACAAALLRQERTARAARLGLWAQPRYAVARAEDHAAVAAERGRFTLVEGKVLSVRESGATIYVNFGRRWSEDFTVTIAKRNARGFAAAGLEPKKLQGRIIRIRGWVEERGGPWIDASRPEQIEVVETDTK